MRNLKSFQLLSVTSPSLDFEIGGTTLSSSLISDTKKNPNFPDQVIFFDVLLPEKQIFRPPLNIILRDHRQFGRRPVVGRLALDLEPFFTC
jgi:hypothetical protein